MDNDLLTDLLIDAFNCCLMAALFAFLIFGEVGLIAASRSYTENVICKGKHRSIHIAHNYNNCSSMQLPGGLDFFYLKWTRNSLVAGLCPDPLGNYIQRSPDPSLDLRVGPSHPRKEGGNGARG